MQQPRHDAVYTGWRPICWISNKADFVYIWWRDFVGTSEAVFSTATRMPFSSSSDPNACMTQRVSSEWFVGTPSTMRTWRNKMRKHGTCCTWSFVGEYVVTAGLSGVIWAQCDNMWWYRRGRKGPSMGRSMGKSIVMYYDTTMITCVERSGRASALLEIMQTVPATVT